jgi:ElaB/YqjD/DUF883 family membrane-anchored ribosome-binding protein
LIDYPSIYHRKGKHMADNRQPAYGPATTPQQASERREELGDRAREAGRDIAGKIQDTGRDIASQIQDAGHDIASQAQSLSAEGQQLASEYYQQGREQALEWQKQLEQHIREKPIQSLCIAGGIGVLLGWLLRR